MRLQEGHGGWTRNMSAVLGKKGFVREIDGDGDAHVEFVNKIKWFFNPALLTIVNTTNMTIQNGDFVFVNDSYEKVKSLQDSAHGGWAESMRETLGEAGVVSTVDRNGRVRVKVGSTSWIYNKLALTLVAKSGEM
ncbi:hypothetical protein NP493_2416g00006 [Ridgeia piscesae]|uniref:Mind bomb SH3 repeat domain-containing protein n=1 Tax=Ridgeia piscesae TaxID=27915 RepID=A0AAD9N387_RIDPI|nr:hypothetical protein NP493_2416g00006 [Ridgeia piscesae]